MKSNTEVGTWLKSNIDYGRKLVDSGLEGARSGREKTLEGRAVSSLLTHSAVNALKPTTIGACLGLGAYLQSRRKPGYAAALACSLVGAAIGFATGVVWDTRRLTATMARGAKKQINVVRDEHWLQQHPIDYA